VFYLNISGISTFFITLISFSTANSPFFTIKHLSALSVSLNAAWPFLKLTIFVLFMTAFSSLSLKYLNKGIYSNIDYFLHISSLCTISENNSTKLSFVNFNTTAELLFTSIPNTSYPPSLLIWELSPIVANAEITLYSIPTSYLITLGLASR